MNRWPTTGNDAREIPGLDSSVPAAERDVRIGSDEGDDLPVSPPEGRPRGTEWGTTAAEQSRRETIDQRIAQEEPDPCSAYGAPLNESGMDGPGRIGGDDPDAIPAEDDFLGESRYQSLDEASDASAEEAAMHLEEQTRW